MVWNRGWGRAWDRWWSRAQDRWWVKVWIKLCRRWCRGWWSNDRRTRLGRRGRRSYLVLRLGKYQPRRTCRRLARGL